MFCPVPGFVRMELAVDAGHNFEPGQWIQLKVPCISSYEWHPMSVASAPGHSTITLDIKVMGDWTRKLEHLASQYNKAHHCRRVVFLDQFHGSSHLQQQGYLNHPSVLMVAGGIGITPMLSAMRALIEKPESMPHIRNVVLVWVVKKCSVLDLYRQELARYQGMQFTPNGCKVSVMVYATLSEEEIVPAAAVTVVEDELFQKKDHFPILDASTPAGGPFMKGVMGRRHELCLTVAAGGGYLTGILFANAIVKDRTNYWRIESVALLQLVIAIGFSMIFVFFGMSAALFRPIPQWQYYEPSEENNNHKNDLEGGRLGSSDDDSIVSTSYPPPLKVELGCRPNVVEIIKQVQRQCKKNQSTSVGVSACGPDALVWATLKAAQNASTQSLPFVLDEESFEW